MNQWQPISTSDQILAEIFSLIKIYNGIIENGEGFQEAKEIRRKIKILVKELREILSVANN